LAHGIVWLAATIRNMSNRYLVTLELQAGASKEEVKKAYRRLSKIYHPDISRDEKAKEKFIEINEAYEFLTKVGPTPNFETISYDYNPEVDEYEERRRMARARARKRAEEEAKLQEELTKKILSIFNYVTLVILIFNLLLSLDYLLPRKIHPQKIIKKTKTNEMIGFLRSNIYSHDEVYFTDFIMKFSPNDKISVLDHKTATVVATPIFRKPLKVIITVGNNKYSYNQSYNIYKVFGLTIPITLLMCLLYFYQSRRLNSKLSYAVALAFISLFQMLIFLGV
jgi:hypothetical protein